MKTVRISAALVAIAAFAITSASAASKNGKSAAAPPTTTHGNPHTTTSPKSSPAATTPKTTHGNPHTTTSPKPSSAAPTPKTHGNPHTSTTAAAPDVPPAPTPSTTPQTVNPIAEKLQNKPLGARIEKMLPVGMTLDTASEGFRNQGQFIAAVHVSQNLGIPFAELKATMLGRPVAGSTTDITSSSPMSLGQAIQRLKPFANATTETARAETQAAGDLKATGTTTSTPTTTSSPTKTSAPTTSTTTTRTTKKPSGRGK